MTELSIRPEEIREAIERYVSSYTPETTREEVGRVIETGDGIARVEGLQACMTNELLEFKGGIVLGANFWQAENPSSTAKTGRLYPDSCHCAQQRTCSAHIW